LGLNYHAVPEEDQDDLCLYVCTQDLSEKLDIV
jgi:hypothetical protein